MIIGVMSDTHGRLDFMQRAADLMVSKFKVDAIVHLGDDYTEAVKMDTKGRQLFAVPGVFESVWQENVVPHRLIKEFGGVKFMLSHTPTWDSHDIEGDLNPGRARSRYGAEVLLHGHTHRRRVMYSVDGLIVICPGHLKTDKDRGEPATFAIIEVKAPDLVIKFANLEGQVIDEHRFTIVRP
ncbi:MAG: YfcE family phosphodiesterase [bacterium]